MYKKRRFGFWFLISTAILLNLMYLFGQTMAMINYDFTVSVGLQESVEEITEVGIAFNKGFGFADTIFYISLFIVGIVGMLRRILIGIYFMFGAMAVTVYWPMVCLSTVYFAKNAIGYNFSNFTEYTVLLSLISFYGLWGLWYLYTNRDELRTSG